MPNAMLSRRTALVFSLALGAPSIALAQSAPSAPPAPLAQDPPPPPVVVDVAPPVVVAPAVDSEGVPVANAPPAPVRTVSARLEVDPALRRPPPISAGTYFWLGDASAIVGGLTLLGFAQLWYSSNPSSGMTAMGDVHTRNTGDDLSFTGAVLLVSGLIPVLPFAAIAYLTHDSPSHPSRYRSFNCAPRFDVPGAVCGGTF